MIRLKGWSIMVYTLYALYMSILAISCKFGNFCSVRFATTLAVVTKNGFHTSGFSGAQYGPVGPGLF